MTRKGRANGSHSNGPWVAENLLPLPALEKPPLGNQQCPEPIGHLIEGISKRADFVVAPVLDASVQIAAAELVHDGCHLP